MPNYYNQFYPQSMNVPQVQMQAQNSNFVSAPNEDFARNYPVALGNSVNFKNETEPYIYVKTMGFSQFDSPKFEKYRLVKEEASEAPKTAQNETIDMQSIILTNNKLKGEIKALWAEINRLKSLNAKPKNNTRNVNGKRDKDGDVGHDE